MSKETNNKKLVDRLYENVRMGSFAIDCIMEKIENEKLANLLRKQNKFYLDTTDAITNLAKTLNFELKDVNFVAKGMSYMSIKTKTLMNNDSPKLAEMLVQGTTMGITDTIKAQSEYPTQNEELSALTQRIIKHEEEFVDSLKTFL